MTKVVTSNTNNIVKVYSVGLQGPAGPSGSDTAFPYTGSAEITGSLGVTGSIIPAEAGVYDLGSEDKYWKDIWVSGGSIKFVSSSLTSSLSMNSEGELVGNFSGSFSGSYSGSIDSASYSDTAVSASYALTASYALNGGGETTDTGSLMLTGSVSSNTLTFTKGDGSTFNLTVNTGSNAISASYSDTAVSASYVLTASYLEGTIVSASYALTATSADLATSSTSASYALTASYALNGGGGGETTDTGSFFTSASSYGPSGSIIFTQGDGSTQTVTVGSSFVTTTLPNSEVILAPTQSYKLIGDNSTWTYPAFQALNPQNFNYSWRYDASSATFTFRDDTNSEWGDVGAGDYIAFKSSNSSNLPAYYEVTGNTYNSSSYGIIRIIGLTPTNTDNVFSAAATASVIASVSVPNVAYSPRISLGYYGGAFLPSNNINTNFTNQVVLVSGSTPSGSWLYIGNVPSSGSQFSATAGQYIGLSTNTSSFTYYVVNGQSYLNASLDYFVGITPVSGEYFAPANSNIYIETTRYIPAQPYYNNLSHITYPITPTSTNDASGSIGDVSYDNNNFYVKRNIGWGKAPLLDIESSSFISPTTGSWTLTPGANTVSFTVDWNRSYQMWVIGNIPNGIVSWTATVNVTNANVPIVGNQYGWYYLDGNALVLTSIPSQIVGTAGSIITTSTGGTENNTFTFGITNNSGTNQTIYYGYIKL
jgi:hypothetical protein